MNMSPNSFCCHKPVLGAEDINQHIMDTSWNIYIYIYIFNQFNCATFVCLLWVTTWISNTVCHGLFLYSIVWSAMVIPFLIGDFVDHHYLYLLFIYMYVLLWTITFERIWLYQFLRAIVVVIVYQNWWCEFKFLSGRARCTTLCDKVCQWLATGRWFSTSYYQKGFFFNYQRWKLSPDQQIS